MNRGYVKLWRKMLDAGWLKNPRLLVFWIYCLLKATHKEFTAIVGAQSIVLLPGQFVFGLRVAVQETGLTMRQIRTILAFLINSGNLTLKTTNKFSIITIVNWHIYQMAYIENDTQNDKPPTNNRQHTRIKEHKKTIYSQDALTVLEYLNQKTGKKFKDASSIESRLKDGGTVQDCKTIIDNKLKDKYFIDNPKYLNSVTLFRKSHWDAYLNEQPVKAVSGW